MIYEVDKDFTVADWEASLAGEAPPSHKLKVGAVATLLGPLTLAKGKLAELVMEEYAVAKSRAYEVVGQAEAAGLIVRDARKLYRVALAANNL